MDTQTSLEIPTTELPDSLIQLHNYHVKSTDLKDLLELSPATMTNIYKKLGINTNLEKGKILQIAENNARRILLERGFKLQQQGHIISLLINKGGAGKSTFTYFLAIRLASFGVKVLVIDTDPQGNSTSSFKLDLMGYPFDEQTPVLNDIIAGNATFEGTIKKVSHNLDLLPSHPMNNFLAETVKMAGYRNANKALKTILAPIRNNYDVILIDCAPALGLVNDIISCASDLLLMPIYPDPFSEMSVNQTLTEMAGLEKDFDIQINKRILFNKFDKREKTSMKYLGQIVISHGRLLLDTVIHTSADFKNAIDSQEDLFGPKFKKSKAPKDIDNLVKEILTEIGIMTSASKENLSH